MGSRRWRRRPTVCGGRDGVHPGDRPSWPAGWRSWWRERRSSASRSSGAYRSGLASGNTSALTEPGAQITVTGSATVQGTPDTVNFQIGVDSTGSTATIALDKSNAEVSNLEAALEAHGVTASEMQTSQLDIYANTDNRGAITGFSVDDDLNVTMNQVSDAGAALDAAADAVGNDVSLNGISFSIANTSSLLATARAEAMANARTEADQLAAGGGVKLGPIVRVTDEENAPVTYNYPVPLAEGAARASVPIETGTQPISVQVECGLLTAGLIKEPVRDSPP